MALAGLEFTMYPLCGVVTSCHQLWTSHAEMNTTCLFLSALFLPHQSSLWHTKQADSEAMNRLTVLQVCGISEGNAHANRGISK